VGVFLDYEGGSISFFNINDQSLISTLKHQFEGLLRPYIQLQIHGEELLNPILICPVPLNKRSFFSKGFHALTQTSEWTSP
jgi:butyrophilin